MKLFYPAPFLLAALLLISGCSLSSSSGEDGIKSARADSSRLYTKAVHVLVDGRDMGIIPMTVRIRRSFGTREVTLWQAGKEIRTYELELNLSSEGSQLLQGFYSSRSMDGDAYDVESLPKAGDDVYVIPYAQRPLKIEDRQYGVTLLVAE